MALGIGVGGEELRVSAGSLEFVWVLPNDIPERNVGVGSGISKMATVRIGLSDFRISVTPQE